MWPGINRFKEHSERTQVGKLRVAVITTPTPHHFWFIQQLLSQASDLISLVLIVMEIKLFPWREQFKKYARKHWRNPLRATILNPYLHIPYFEKQQYDLERKRFFNGNAPSVASLRGVAPVAIVDSANEMGVRDGLQKERVDIALSYGPGLLKPETFSIPRLGTINAHGGILPYYRGMDTNLWACLEGRHRLTGVTLHQMDATLDTGPVYFARQLYPTPDMSVLTLRYYTTLIATGMFIDLLRVASSGDLWEPIKRVGVTKYYPPMPFLYKPFADWRLRRWAKTTLSQPRQGLF